MFSTALRSRREADQLLVPIDNRRRSAGSKAIGGESERVDEAEHEEVDDDDGADDGDDRSGADFCIDAQISFLARCAQAMQAHEPLLDQLLACVAWFYNTKRTSLVKAVRDVETAMMFSEKQQQ
jgi:hypothetical protein